MVYQSRDGKLRKRGASRAILCYIIIGGGTPLPPRNLLGKARAFDTLKRLFIALRTQRNIPSISLYTPRPHGLMGKPTTVPSGDSEYQCYRIVTFISWQHLLSEDELRGSITCGVVRNHRRRAPGVPHPILVINCCCCCGCCCCCNEQKRDLVSLMFDPPEKRRESEKRTSIIRPSIMENQNKNDSERTDRFPETSVDNCILWEGKKEPKDGRGKTPVTTDRQKICYLEA